jgi:cellulose synthase/poly-beta-1,6-N-acetylglucosamine synthase-like glycosyltransferase
MSQKRVAILSLWRDSEDYIERSLAQFEALEEAFKEEETAIIPIYGFFENDSQDNTAQILEEWLKDRIGFVVAETINAPKWGSVSSLERVRYQARYRNSALTLLNRYSYDYLLVVDSDVHWEPDCVLAMLDFLEEDEMGGAGMVSPNTVQNVRDYVEDTDRETYFDSWSLVDIAGNQCLTFAANPFLDPDDRLDWENGVPVACNSAFGSIAMVKQEALKDVQWDVIDGVEHWEFCKKIRENGYRVFADPMIHARVIHKEKVTALPSVIEYQRDRLKKFSLQELFMS